MKLGVKLVSVCWRFEKFEGLAMLGMVQLERREIGSLVLLLFKGLIVIASSGGFVHFEEVLCVGRV